MAATTVAMRTTVLTYSKKEYLYPITDCTDSGQLGDFLFARHSSSLLGLFEII